MTEAVFRYPDSTVRFVFEQCAVRGVWVSLDEAFAEAHQRHPYSAMSLQLLGESLAAAVLLSSTIKLQGRLALQARGDAALRLLVAECTHDGGIRGVVEYDDMLANTLAAPVSLQDVLGSGYLAVTLLPDAGDSYQGVVPLRGQRLQEGIAEYFAQSEQLPTALWLACDGRKAAGLLLQALPDDRENSSETWQHLSTLAGTLTDAELLALPVETLLHRLFHEESVRIFAPEAVRFSCTCTAERSRNALAVLGRDELHKLFVDQPEVSIDCQFCRRVYYYTAADMADVLGESPQQLH